MNVFEYLDSMPLTQALGWTMIHFIWQGALLGVLAGAVLALAANSTARVRYAVCCGGMLVMMAAPLVTLAVMLNSPQEPAAMGASGFFFLDVRELAFWSWIEPALPWLTLFWITGTCLFQGRLFMQWSTAQRLKRSGIRSAPPRWQRVVLALCDQLRVRRTVRLLESSLVQVPMVMGWLKPVILVPGYVLTGLTPKELRMVIAHELAHVRRHDYIINIVQALFESLLFYHPGVWWLSGRLRVEREYCCDDIAVSLCRDPLSYARALSSLDALRGEGYQAALASTGGSLMNRIFRILGVPSKPANRVGGWLAPIVIAASVLLAVSAVTFAQECEKKKKKCDEPPKIVKSADKEEDAIRKKEQMLVEKMKKAGKSEKEIKMAVMQLWDDWKKEKASKKTRVKKTVDADDAAMLKKKEEKIRKKMTSEGKSKKEIEKAIQQMHADYKAWKEKEAKAEYEKYEKKAKERELVIKKKEEELIKKMKAAGKSKEEIKKALGKLREEYEKEKPPPSKKKAKKKS